MKTSMMMLLVPIYMNTVLSTELLGSVTLMSWYQTHVTIVVAKSSSFFFGVHADPKLGTVQLEYRVRRHRNKK